VLIDDSIVRGTTSRKIVEMVRSAGAKEVHLRISSPPTVSPCHYGIDTPTHDELIGNQKSIEKIREFTGADSLAYLTLEGLKASVTDQGNFCMACFDRSYPIPIEMKSPQKLLFDAEETAGS
jgi:amidophosphoribosyltransferase